MKANLVLNSDHGMVALMESRTEFNVVGFWYYCCINFILLLLLISFCCYRSLFCCSVFLTLLLRLCFSAAARHDSTASYVQDIFLLLVLFDIGQSTWVCSMADLKMVLHTQVVG
jgi:hypothetical protein